VAGINSLTPQDQHLRFTQQARWTGQLRRYLFQKTGLESAQRVLEVGCGTGAVLAGLHSSGMIHGLDLDRTRLIEAADRSPGAVLTCGDASDLPFSTCRFDLTFCHFLLLWVSDPVQVLREMCRVTQPGGNVIAMAEPDYSQRIDHPEALVQLGQWQTASLRQQGADPDLGSKLAGLFIKAGMRIIESGSLKKRGNAPLKPDEWKSEWKMIEADLQGMVEDEELQRLKQLDHNAWKSGERVLYIPTFYVWGKP
jgi:SAM-dependent methyltransferase